MSSVILKRLLKYKISSKYCGIIINKRNFASHSDTNIIKSALPDIEIPNEPIHQFIFKHFSKFPHKVAVECGLTGRKYTYEELRIKSRNLNKSLRKKLKLQKRDVVAILLPNIPEYPICMLGSIEAGLTVTTINPAYTSEEIKRQLLDADVKAIFTISGLWNNASAAVNLTQEKIPIIIIKSQENQDNPDGSIYFEELVDSRCDIEDLVLETGNDTILMPYSSGTTGLPKGVEHTHSSIISTICQINTPYFRQSETTTDTHQDVIPAVLPFFHIYGLVVTLFTKLWNLSKVVSLPHFTPELFVGCLQKHKPSILYTVPPLVTFMTNNAMIKKEYFQSTRTVVCGAAPLGASDEERFTEKVGKHVNILQGYGLTESCVTVFTTPSKKSELGLSGSVGELLPNITTKVVPPDNPEKEPLGPHKFGELLIKGPQVTKGYLNKPKETNETFIDGWMRTGDLVYYDDNKMFYVVDRLKELIKVKGFQVAPAELEEILRSYPDVDDAAVIGIPHVTYGEVPRAYIVPKSNAKIDLEELHTFVNEKVAEFKHLKGGITFTKSIPKTASGKIVRRELQRLYKKEIK
ncbi:hypothetical protein ILUMI_11819 [Ignelater luminosus]|uniref:4-coumarate--CoA ligase n=1 Tax=Ignelater luminosus TaxID=2038154 RepID=A0A8K0D484_IGNLU|nr:hypothetical protein ILUMI_11819 [Ignelater luminosus]